MHLLPIYNNIKSNLDNYKSIIIIAKYGYTGCFQMLNNKNSFSRIPFYVLQAKLEFDLDFKPKQFGSGWLLF